MDVRAGALQEAWLQDVSYCPSGDAADSDAIISYVTVTQVAAEVSLPAVGPSVSQLLLPTVETELRRLIQLAKKYQLRLAVAKFAKIV